MKKIASALVVASLVSSMAIASPSIHDFPIPADAVAHGSAPGAGDAILLYDVPRTRDTVATELRAALKTGGWTLKSDQTSPRGAIRLVAVKGDVTMKASVTDNGGHAAIILTLP